MKYILPTLLFGFLMFVISFTTDRTVKTEPNLQISFSSIEKHLENAPYQQFGAVFKYFFEQSDCPGAAIVVVKDTSVIIMDGLGVKTVNSTDSVDTNTIFRLGSVSKGFTGILTGMLVNKKYLDWDTKVKEHVPDFVLNDEKQASNIEIRHLLSHTTGLPLHSYTNLLEEDMGIKEIMPKLKSVDLISKEGQLMSYQNVAFAIIEEVLKSSTNKSFEQLLEDNIFTPANMRHSSCSILTIDSTSNMAMPHRWNSVSKKYYPTKQNNKYYNAPSAGGINTSISDASQWLQILLGNRPDIVPLHVLDSVFAPEVSTSRNRKYFNRWSGVKKSYYAKGWRVIEFGSRTIMHHGGYVNQYRSEIAVDRKNKLAICVLFNAPSRHSSQVVPLFFSYCDSLDNIQLRKSTLN
ncbi:serine hydrolase domain-containing protein [Reichenbachiella sp. MALMAid0571]|uniref:serine hydrolase domain-containing protein n=1 Tax=Reichenbachiella sp. MALMAid0571 TaxID=3143939 RepID=UPI0032DF1EEF